MFNFNSLDNINTRCSKMKLFCVTLLLLVFVTVESHHEERYRHHMGRGYGWRNRGYGWRDRGYGGGYNNHRYRENRRHWRREIKSQSNLFKFKAL